jgi:anti-sigma factor RsiW
MNQEQQLELQAYLDGELRERAARRVAEWLASDPEARALLTELKLTKTVLAGNEPERAVPESQEFYWRRIEHAIEAQTAPADRLEPKPALGWLLALRKYLAPVSGLALVAILALAAVRFSNLPGAADPSRYLIEVENLSEHVTAHAFSSRSEKMFVVWLDSHNQEEAADTEEEEVFVQ